MNDGMSTLKDHHRRLLEYYPEDDLLVLFEIEGVILDMRHLVRWVLLDFDRHHGSDYFYGLRPEDIPPHEYRVGALLKNRGIFHCERERILEWYYENLSSLEAVLAAHMAHTGVMDVIRWTQLQPRTQVGLYTGRPESMQRETLSSLNALGHDYGVRFHKDLLFMNPSDQGLENTRVKLAGLRHFQTRGYRVSAIVDKEADGIAATTELETGTEILFLNVDDLLQPQERPTPHAVNRYAPVPVSDCEPNLEGSLV
jgi:hypothetical protein